MSNFANPGLDFDFGFWAGVGFCPEFVADLESGVVDLSDVWWHRSEDRLFGQID